MELTKILGLTTYTFIVDGVTFRIAAQNVCDAYAAANCKVREEKLVGPDESFAWFDTLTPGTYRLYHDVFLD